MKRSATTSLLAALLAVPHVARGSEARPAPEFPSRDAASWIGEPVQMAGLRGSVVLLDVWTFG